MTKLLFACDMDNTLIYSHRYPHEGWECVEWIQGREQSFVSPETKRGLLRLSSRLTPVAVTSRTVRQYLRLEMPVPCAGEGRDWEHMILPVLKVQNTAAQYPRKAGTPKNTPLGG